MPFQTAEELEEDIRTNHKKWEREAKVERIKSDIAYLTTIIITILSVIFIITLLSFIIISPTYYASSQEARIFNQLNNTNYSTWDFFWAGNQINAKSQTIKLQ